ncbi:MAG: protein kinase [Pyrinomonadaceae bacterium]
MATETNVIGNYRIEERIGRGGMGVVYRGHHLQLPREVAIKSIIARDNSDLRHLKARFEKEAYIQSQLDHPGIVKIYDYVVAEQTYYIVMEYVRGRSLAQLLARETCPLPVSRALDLFEQILTAIAYTQEFVYVDQQNLEHRGLVHRDLKPANIIVTPDDRTKITDFGIVKLVGAENTDTFGPAYGSPQYVSPEQAEGRAVDERSDIYSLGIILYEMLTCASPFDGDTKPLSRTDVLRAHVEQAPRPPSELNAEITPELEAVILRALEKNPDKRFRSGLEFLRAVRRARGRDMKGIAEEIAAPPFSPRLDANSDTDDFNGRSTGRGEREGYATQPIGTPVCAACGTTAQLNDRNCRACGQSLNASPSTVKLTRREALSWQKNRARGLWLFAALFGVALLSAGLFYVRRQRADEERRQAGARQSIAATQPTPAPASSLVEIHPSRVRVDSSYNGYGIAPLTDGETDVRKIARLRYNKGNWSSDETPAPHWIELEFDRPTRLAAVYIYWGFDRNRFTPSRRVELQMPDDKNEWRTVSMLEPGDDYDRTAFTFAPFETMRARVFQPPQQGPSGRPFVMWIREVKAFAASDSSPAP